MTSPSDNNSNKEEDNHEEEEEKEEVQEEEVDEMKEVNRPEFLNPHPVPIILEGLGVQKDVDAANAENESSLQTAPNFASAILGRWLATKVGLASPSPAAGSKNTNVASSIVAHAQQQEEQAKNSSGEHVLKNVHALLLPGEGTLLLGPSSSGKTTLMRTIQSVLGGTTAGQQLEGSITLGKLEIPASEADEVMKGKNYGRLTAFADQGDLSLTPILTVLETIRFARLCAEGQEEYTDESILAFLELLGLDHVKDTVVGNADIRGVSGGQKRRVKVLEMAVGKDVSCLLIDEPSNGLDAASALSLCQVLSAVLQASRITAMVSLLQPSTEVFETFQRLLLLTPDGQVAFSGRREEVLPYFEQTLGLTKPETMNVPEFLLRCIYAPHEFQAPGEVPMVPLTSSDDWAKAFQQSQAGQDLMDEIKAVKANAMASEGMTLPTLDAWAISTMKQISLLMERGWKLVTRNPVSIMRVVMAIFFGAFIGTLFLNTSDDADGTFTRGGYVLTLLFLTFLNSCMSPLEDLFHDRNTFYIHRRGMLYRTASYYINQVLCSAPVPLLESFFLGVITFFLVGMNNHGQPGWGFLYFWLLFSLVALSGSAISRILAYSLPTEEVAQTMGPAALLLMVLTTGYSPQYLQLPPWLRWMSWLSPCAYCYEGVMVNEVWNRNVGPIPGSNYAQIALQIPRIPYDEAPTGMDSPLMLMAFDAYMLVAIIIILETIGCFLLHRSQSWYGPSTKRYQVAAGMSLASPPTWITMSQEDFRRKPKRSRKNSSNRDLSITVPQAPPAHLTAKAIVYEVDVPVVEVKEPEKSDEPEKAASSTGSSLLSTDESYNAPITIGEYGQSGRGSLTEGLLKRRLGSDAVHSGSQHMSLQSASQTIRVELPPTEPGRLRLLSGVSASFEPGTMTALMGSSGAGKTTLLDVLAGYKTGGHIMGEICINGEPKTDELWKSIAGYCEQVDLHNAALTVRESLIFAARLRLRPFSISDEAKVAFATHVLKLLDLGEFGDMLVGDESSGEGLPKHARKRLTVGVELCANPSVLFADEPTSGLDSLSASVVVASLERAAKQEGLTIVCTIHQPSRSVFEAFDNLLLLRKGGVCVYNGLISGLQDHMISAPNGEKYAMPEGLNPADHTLDIFCGPGGEDQDWSELYEKSEMAAKVKRGHEVDAVERGAIAADTTPQSFVSELFIEIQRELLVMWRTPTYMATRMWWTVSASLLVGVIYLDAGSSNQIQNVIGAIFFFSNVATVPLLSAMTPLIKSRAVFYREVASGTYRRLVYGIAVQVAEIPFNLLAASLSFVIIYFLVGLNMEVERILYFLLMALATYWFLPTFGQLLAFTSPNIGSAVGIGSLALTLFTLTQGFLIPPDKIPVWYIWIYWINPLRYILQGIVSNQVGGTPEGDAFLETFGWSYNDRWFYCYVAILLMACACSLAILPSTRISWLKR